MLRDKFRFFLISSTTTIDNKIKFKSILKRYFTLRIRGKLFSKPLKFEKSRVGNRRHVL